MIGTPGTRSVFATPPAPLVAVDNFSAILVVCLLLGSISAVSQVRSWSSAGSFSRTAAGNRAYREADNRNFFCSWATHVNRKWTYSLWICLVASKFVLLRVFSLIETICPNICSKSSLKSAKSSLPVDARPSKWSLLFRHHQSTIVVPKKWEILCNAPSTENPWKLLITTNSLELSYPVI